MKIPTGPIKFKESVKKLTPEKVVGSIVKIRIYNKETNPDDLFLTIKTIDGETLINREIGNRSMIFYPRNSYAVNEVLYLDKIDLMTVKPNGQAELFYSEDELIIELKTRTKPAKETNIENIVITVK